MGYTTRTNPQEQDMAKKTKPNVGDQDGERQGYVPGAPGIHEPFVIAEGGHEGARAVYEYGYMAEGRITESDKPRDKFVDYDTCFKINVEGGATD